MKRRLLLLVTTRSYRAGAFLAASSALDLDLTVGSEREQALAAHHPRGHLVLDFRSPDTALGKILEFAREHPVHAVIGADDECALLAARATEALGLAGHASAGVAAARDKAIARGRLAAAGLATPPFAVLPLDGPPSRAPIEFPCVLKPRGLSASRGVMRADDPHGFAAAFARVRRILEREGQASPGEPPRDSMLVERFIPGREVALEGLVTDGALRVLALFDKPDPLDGPCFEETIYVTPSRLPPEVRRRVAEAAGAGARALGLRHGPIHAEFRVNAEGVWPLEIAPRSIGGLCSRAVCFEDGESLETVLLRHALGEPDTIRPDPLASGVMMIPIPGPGRLRGVRGVEEARAVAGVVELRMTLPIGSPLVPLPEGAQYLGFIFARADSPDRAERSLRESHGRLKFDIEAPAPAGEELHET